MAITACPHCHKSIELKAIGAGETPENSLGRAELHAVKNFLATQPPGRQTTSEVFDNYEWWRTEIEKGSPKITKNGLARALRTFGATPWRNALGRGWVIPAVKTADPTPSPAPSVRGAEDKASYLDSVARSGRPASQPGDMFFDAVTGQVRTVEEDAEVERQKREVDERVARGEAPF